MKYKAILFDLDGTLLNTLEDIAHSLNSVLRDHGLPTHPVNKFRYMVGDGRFELVRRAVSEYREDESFLRKIVSEMDERYAQCWKEKTRPYEGVDQMLNMCRRSGLVMCVLSNKKHEFTQEMVSSFFSSHSFELVAGHRENIPLKPDPVAALSIAEELGVKPDRFLYMGDTNTDMQTAVSSGMYPIGVLWGFRDRRELEEAGARTILKLPREIESLLS